MKYKTHCDLMSQIGTAGIEPAHPQDIPTVLSALLLAESASLLSLTGFLRHCHRSYVPVASIRLLPLFDRLTCCQSAIGFNFRFEHDRTGNRSGRIRTCDTISSSQLSYAPIFAGLSRQSEHFRLYHNG